MTTRFLDRGDGVRLAYRLREGAGPTIVFLPGFGSNMLGDKAEALDRWAADMGRACLRLDYSGCGQSDGSFLDGTLTRWRNDALLLIDRLTTGPLLLVGSSMGGWMALLVALARPERIAGLVGIAAAPDFTAWGFSDARRAAIIAAGHVTNASPYGGAITVTGALLADGAANLLLEGPIALDAPIRLLHGQRDAEVPWELATRLAARLRSADVQTILIKDGEHRLSRPGDIALLLRTVAALTDSP